MAKISPVTRSQFPVTTPTETVPRPLDRRETKPLGAGRKLHLGSHRWKLVGRRAVFRAPNFGRSDQLSRMSLVPTAMVAAAGEMFVGSTRPLSV